MSAVARSVTSTSDPAAAGPEPQLHTPDLKCPEASAASSRRGPVTRREDSIKDDSFCRSKEDLRGGSSFFVSRTWNRQGQPRMNDIVIWSLIALIALIGGGFFWLSNYANRDDQ